MIYEWTAKDITREVNKLISKWYNRAKRDLPYDTGNLINNGFRIQQNGLKYEIYIDLNKADYALYLNDSEKHDNYINEFIERFTKGFMFDIRNKFAHLIIK